jgi:flagellar motor switch protein FliN/FliY
MGIFEDLIERWMEEFGRAVEMFTGEKPVLTTTAAPSEVSAALVAGNTWWKQVAEGETSFAMWAGATEPLWTALGEGVEGQTTFFEMLSQANQGTVAVFSAGFPVPLRCQDGVMESPTLPLAGESVEIKVGFRGSDAGLIILLVERSALAVFGPDEPASAVASDEPLRGVVTSPVMLSRLMDLQLPVSVLLGRATITIKDALKLMSGSVIELDRQVGDYVDVMVHGTVVARGEIVSVKGNYGVRIKEVISRQDRIALHEAA